LLLAAGGLYTGLNTISFPKQQGHPRMSKDITVVVRGGALAQIEKDPDFGRKLCEAIRHHEIMGRPIEAPAGNHGNAVQVVESHDSNITAVVTVGGGHGIVQTRVGGIRHTEDEFKRRLIERWASELGLTVGDADPAKPAPRTGPGM
jgi:hypothetical protein